MGPPVVEWAQRGIFAASQQRSAAMPSPEDLAPLAADMTAWRQDFHRHPELGFEEARTAGIVAGLLREWGIAVEEGIGVTGVVGTLTGTRAAGGNRAVGAARGHGRAGDAGDDRRRPMPARPPARCMPAGMTGTRRCCWARRAGWRRIATASAAPCISCSSRPRNRAAVPPAWWRRACSSASPSMPSTGCTTCPACRSAPSRCRRAPCWPVPTPGR